MHIRDFLKEVDKRTQPSKKAGKPSRPNSRIPPNSVVNLPKGPSLGPQNTRRQQRQLQMADIAILVALPLPEQEQVTNSFGGIWRQEGREGALFNVAEIAFGGQTTTVVLGVQNYMGMVSAAVLASKAIRGWAPRLLIMTGICAGVRKEVNLGDIIIPRQVFDYGSGKLKQGKLYPDYQHVALDPTICNYVMSLAADKQVLKDIKFKWQKGNGLPVSDLRAKMGDFASGAAVVADPSVVDGIREHKRSLLGIDMEAYGFARAAVDAGSEPTRFLIVKGVQDFADRRKNDDVRDYAAFVSAEFVRRFLDRYWRDLCSPTNKRTKRSMLSAPKRASA